MYLFFFFLQGEQGLPGLGSPGIKGDKVSVYVCVVFLHDLTRISFKLNLPDSPAFTRASVVCVSHQRLAAVLPASKCLRE